MSDSVDVSIVAITYNHQEFIRNALEGFLAQELDGLRTEIIVADDASTDETPTVIAEYCDSYPDRIVSLRRPQNVGVVSNLLDAMCQAKGRYIALCEGDDYWTDPAKIRLQYEAMEQNTAASLCFHSTVITHTDASVADKIGPSSTPNGGFTLENLLRVNFIPTNSVMYRNLGGYEGLASGDVLPLDLLLHVYHALRGEIMYLDRVMSVYRRHPQGVWWSADGPTAFAERNTLRQMRFYLQLQQLLSGRPALQELAVSEMQATLRAAIHTLRNNESAVLHRLVAEFPEEVVTYLRASAAREEILQARIARMPSRRMKSLAIRLRGRVRKWASARERSPAVSSQHV